MSTWEGMLFCKAAKVDIFPECTIENLNFTFIFNSIVCHKDLRLFSLKYLLLLKGDIIEV